MSLRLGPLLIAAAAVLALPGCGLPSQTPTSWVGGDTTTAILIQFTRTGSNLQGGMDLTTLKTGAETTNSQRAPFTGVTTDGKVTLTFNEGLGVTTAITGAMTSTRMTLNFPDTTTGVMTPVALHPGQARQYNAKVNALQVKAADNHARAVRAAAEAQAEAQLQGASDAVEHDVNAVGQIVAAGVSFSQFDSDMAAAKKDLGAAQTDAAKARSEGRGSYNGCYDAGNAVYDAGNVKYDAGAIDYDAGQVQDTIDSVGGHLRDLSGHYQALADLEAARGVAVPGADTAAVRSVQQQGDAAVRSWKATAAGYQVGVGKLVVQAQAVAVAAQKAVC